MKMINVELEAGLSRVRTISFDGDDTLWDFRSAMENALALTLRQLRTVVANDATHRLTVQKMIEIRNCVANEPGETINLDEIRYKAFIRTVEYVGAPNQEIARQLFQFYMDTRLAGTNPYTDVPGALKRLKDHYRIGLISNGNSKPVLSRLPVTFDFTVFAQDCGFAKPDPRIFGLALAASRCEPEEFLHIGDSLKDDVLGASNSGLLSAWLNRQGISNKTGITPDLEIRDLNGLVTILEGSSRKSSRVAHNAPPT